MSAPSPPPPAPRPAAYPPKPSSNPSNMGSQWEVVLAVMAGLEATWAFSAMNPSIFTIRAFGPSNPPEVAKHIRTGYVIATGLSLGFAGLVGALMPPSSKRWLPLAVAGGISVVFIGIYEAALRGWPP